MSEPRDRAEILMMKVVDGFATDEERRELDELIARWPELGEELEDFEAIKAATDDLTARILQDATIEPPRPTPAARSWSRASWLLILIATVGLLAFAAWTLATDASIPPLVKILTGLLAAGMLGLLAQALRTRLRARGRDPYQEIDQ